MKNLKEIINSIDTDYISEYLGENYAEELEFTKYNIQNFK